MNLVSSSEKQFQHSSAKQLQVMDMVVVEREDPEIDKEFINHVQLGMSGN